MDAPRRLLIFLFVGLPLACGCQSKVNAPPDPFAQTPQKALDGRITGAGAPSEQPGEPIPEENPSTWQKITKALSPDSVESSLKAVAGRAPNEAVAKSLYSEADNLFAEKKFDEAAEKFEEAA